MRPTEPQTHSNRSVGIDFGTSNSALAVVDHDSRSATVATFHLEQKETPNYPSVVFVPNNNDSPPKTGNAAWEAYHESWDDGRLLKSLKHFLTDDTFGGTVIAGKRTTLEELISKILIGLRTEAEKQFGALGNRATVGRPVRFVNQRGPADEALAEARLRAAFARAGFTNIEFCLEPVGAAFSFQGAERSKSTREKLIFIGDIGGGTSDFCILRLPAEPDDKSEVLAAHGLSVAGDVIDGSIIFHTVCPVLGFRQSYTNEFKTVQKIPDWIFQRFSNLSRFPSLRTGENLRTLNDISRFTQGVSNFNDLNYFVKENLGYAVFELAARAKIGLSQAEQSNVTDSTLRSCSHLTITRSDVTHWVAESMSAIRAGIHETLQSASLSETDIDEVFLTGGSSLFAPFRNEFELVFGADKVLATDEFGAVVKGLAMHDGMKAH